MHSDIEQLAVNIKQHVKEEGFSEIAVSGAGVFQASKPHAPMPNLYEPMICLVAQGAKNCRLGDSTFRYAQGDLFVNFLPIPVATEITLASPQQPLLSSAIQIDLAKLADITLRIERIQLDVLASQPLTATSVVHGPAPADLVRLFIKLLEVANHPMDAAILGGPVIDEIYYRLLTSEYGTGLRLLLNSYGQIQPISRAVSYIHDNLHRTIHINDLADITNMSKTTFFNAFKKIMHVAPNQYIKSTRLRKAQLLLKQGMLANEASYNVGYNSFSQFSREYKRLFGFPPSQTAAHVHI